MPKYSKTQKALMRKIPSDKEKKKINDIKSVLDNFTKTFPGFVKGHLINDARCIHCEKNILEEWGKYKDLQYKSQFTTTYHCGDFIRDDEDEYTFCDHIKISSSGKTVSYISCDLCII